MIETITTIISALTTGIPKLIDAIKAGRNPADIKLGEFISEDAVDTIDKAIKKAESFESKFK